MRHLSPALSLSLSLSLSPSFLFLAFCFQTDEWQITFLDHRCVTLSPSAALLGCEPFGLQNNHQKSIFEVMHTSTCSPILSQRIRLDRTLFCSRLPENAHGNILSCIFSGGGVIDQSQTSLIRKGRGEEEQRGRGRVAIRRQAVRQGIAKRATAAGQCVYADLI